MTPEWTFSCTFFFLTRLFQSLVSLAQAGRLAWLALFECAPGRTAFGLDSFARIERLPHGGSLIRAYFFFFHGALKRRSF
jgi:hypothetical protein